MSLIMISAISVFFKLCVCVCVCVCVYILFSPPSVQIALFQGNALAVQWLGLCTSTAGGPGLIPVQDTKILQAQGAAKNKNKKDSSVLDFTRNFHLQGRGSEGSERQGSALVLVLFRRRGELRPSEL